MVGLEKSAILLTGGSGQVGTEIQARGFSGHDLIAPASSELNIADPEAVRTLMASRSWAAVINCAAYTGVDQAEVEPMSAWATNADGPAALARACQTAQIPLIHISTDYVFDGEMGRAYVETDPIAPLGVYGASKAAGELAVRAICPRHVILRTAWVVSAQGRNFARTMLGLAGTRDHLQVVNDQTGCPTAAGDIADCVIAIAERLLTDPDTPLGTYHFVNAGQASWFDLASAIFRQAQAQGVRVPALTAVSTDAYPTLSRRPKNSRLDTGRLTSDFGMTPRPWQVAVEEVVSTLLAGMNPVRA